MSSFSIGIVGGSGYTGGELVRLVDAHPTMSLEVIAGHSSAGKTLSEVQPHLLGGDRPIVSVESAIETEVDLMFLALPHGASAIPAMALLERRVKVVDLGSDFRLADPEIYATAYLKPHPFPEELGQWSYGLPEINRGEIAGREKVAVPGCFPTGAILAVAPLVEAGLIDATGIVVDAMTGASGGGRTAKEHLSFGAIDEGVRAYGVTTHRHRPEMEQAIGAHTGATVRVSFTPHLVPLQRGLLSTCSAPLANGATADEVTAVLHKAYADEPFVDVINDPPLTRWVVGSNRCVMSAHVDANAGRAIAISAIDNLGKGAAGQAVQCANLMLELPEVAGLPLAGWMP